MALVCRYYIVMDSVRDESLPLIVVEDSVDTPNYLVYKGRAASERSDNEALPIHQRLRIH